MRKKVTLHLRFLIYKISRNINNLFSYRVNLNITIAKLTAELNCNKLYTVEDIFRVLSNRNIKINIVAFPTYVSRVKSSVKFTEASRKARIDESINQNGASRVFLPSRSECD